MPDHQDRSGTLSRAPEAGVSGAFDIFSQRSVPARERGRKDTTARVTWVDHAKGWSIILVVMMHSTLGVGYALGEDSGWLHAFVAFAKPFRMPDFFLVAGLFAGAAIEGPRSRFVDTKVVHFVYFYVLWLLLELAFKASSLGILTPSAFAEAYFWHLVQPFSSMWFIQLLPLLYVSARLLRGVPPALSLSLAVVLHYIAAAVPAGGHYFMESNVTRSVTVSSFLLFWIYFLLGIYFRNMWFRMAAISSSRPLLAVLGLASWALVEHLATQRGLPEVFGLDLPFGVLGAAAVIVASSLLARVPQMSWLAFLGSNSLPIYLAFFLPMAATRILALKFFPHANLGVLAAAVTFAGVVGPIALLKASRVTGLTFLFRRPAWARLNYNRGNKGVDVRSAEAA